MNLHDWLIFLHLLGAFLAVSALVALWAIVFATKPAGQSLDNAAAMRIGNIAGPIVGAGMGVALIFGIWLAFQIDGYHVWDPWILAAIVLWGVGAWSGAKSGKLFVANVASKRQLAVKLQVLSSLMVLVILILMIWKPGA